MVSYESRSVSRAEKFISLVLYVPLGAADTHTHTGEMGSERDVVKSFHTTIATSVFPLKTQTKSKCPRWLYINS